MTKADMGTNVDVGGSCSTLDFDQKSFGIELDIGRY